MKYSVEYLPRVYKTLQKMDKFTRRMIVEWIEKNLVGCENPRQLLSSKRAGEWRYRVGEYRIIAKIEDEKLVILVISVGHRREIYNS